MPTPEVLVRECTTAGCGISLTVSFESEVPADFVMLAQAPDMGTLEVHCINGEGQYAPDHFQGESYMVCQGDIVEIYNFSPPGITITVNSSAKSISEDFNPTYDLTYPNGPDCEPECRVGSIVFSMSPQLSFESAVYQDESAGYAFDYPADWTQEGPTIAGDRGYIAQFTSYSHEPGEIPDVQPPGSSQLQASVLLWDPKNQLEAYINHHKQGWALSGNSILMEERHTLNGDLQAASFVIDSFGTPTYFLLAAIGDRYLVISGQGEMDLLDEIGNTVRPLK